MRDRRERILKGVCLLFGLLLVVQLARLVVPWPFSRLTVPALPSLPPDPEAQNSNPTNSAAGKNSAKSATNGPSSNAFSIKTTNNPSSKEAQAKNATNSINHAAAVTNQTNSVTQNSNGTSPQATNLDQNASAPKAGAASDSAPVVALAGKGTNVVLTGTNREVALTGTNAPKGGTNAAKGDTNSLASIKDKKKGASPGGRPNMPGKAAELPPEIKDRVERIVQGEILGQVMRPMPMALLGIAGESAFLRGPDGQTGLVKEGDQLGALKLLRIGTNRVLVEQDGEKKELTIFAGLGSESLMPKEPREAKPKDPKKSDEPAKKTPDNPAK